MSVTYAEPLAGDGLDGWVAATRWEVNEGVPQLVSLSIFRKDHETPVGRGDPLNLPGMRGFVDLLRKEARRHGFEMPAAADVVRTCPTSSGLTGCYDPEEKPASEYLTVRMLRSVPIGAIAMGVRHNLAYHNRYTARLVDPKKYDPAVGGRRLDDGALADLCERYIEACAQSAKPVVELTEVTGLTAKMIRSRLKTAQDRGLMVRPKGRSKRPGGKLTPEGRTALAEYRRTNKANVEMEENDGLD